MNYFYTFLLCLSISLCSFSQVITFECNNEIIFVSFDEISDNPNASIDWNGDGVVDESDYVIYFQQVYNCDTACNDIVTAVVDCAPCSEGQTMIFWEEFDEANCTLFEMCGCENNDVEWNAIDWVLSDWEDFDWVSVWDEFNLGNAIDWNNIPWDEIIDLNLIPDDLLDYIVSVIAAGQPFNWGSFLSAQSCNDDDDAVSIGLSIWTDISGCGEAVDYIYSQGFSCATALNMPFVSAEPISLFELCCETCSETEGDPEFGCTDEWACNYNPDATVDDGSCEDGVVECFVSPCSVSETPGVPGAYCVDDYCEGCCALWYNSEGMMISNSCEDEIGDDSIVGVWYDEENNQYNEITEDVIGFYTFLEEGVNCWYYFSIDYTYIGNGQIEIMDEYYGPTIISSSISESGDLELMIPDDYYPEGYDMVTLNSLDELPELDMCDFGGGDNEGCEDLYGQWTYFDLVYIIIDEYGAKIMYPVEDDAWCYEVMSLSYNQDEGSDLCQMFIGDFGVQIEFAQAFLNNDGTLSFIVNPIMEEGDSSFPEIWTSNDTDLSGLEACIYGCTDSEACNYDPFANSDNGTCGLVDDCGDCQIPYCYDMATSSVEYITEDQCDELWVGNDCEEDPICLSNPMNPYWNAGCNTFIEENLIPNKPQSIINIIGQGFGVDKSGLRIYLHKDGRFEKKYIVE